MSDFLFLARVILMRIVYALIVIVVIFNPWFSLWQLLAPDNQIDLLDLESGWLYKLIAVLVLAGAVILFARTTGQSMGKWGVAFMLVLLGLIAYVPFYAGWLPPTETNIVYLAYFFVFPVLLGIGLSTGYINRWLNGTLITKPVSAHDSAIHHAAAAHSTSATTDTGHHG